MMGDQRDHGPQLEPRAGCPRTGRIAARSDALMPNSGLGARGPVSVLALALVRVPMLALVCVFVRGS